MKDKNQGDIKSNEILSQGSASDYVAFTMPCLNCKKPVKVKKEGYEAQGIFNVFCPDGKCEDRLPCLYNFPYRTLRESGADTNGNLLTMKRKMQTGRIAGDIRGNGWVEMPSPEA